LARYYLRLGRSVGLVAVGQNLVLLPPDRGPRQLGKILDALAVLRCEGTLPLQGLLETQSHHLMQGTTVVFVTPETDPTLALVADNLTRQALRPVAVLVDPSTFGSAQNNAELVLQMQMLGVPLRQVRAGDDLALVLASEHPAN
jgi:uncharacterized protein (DUF58 family)